jgi:hypothetical protein
LSDEIKSLEKQSENLREIEKEFVFVKGELLNSYNMAIGELDRMFTAIKTKLAEEHYKSRE